MRAAEALRTASIMMMSSTRFSLAGPAGGVDDEYVLRADRVVDLDVDLAVPEPADRRPAGRDAEMRAYVVHEPGARRSGEDHHRIRVERAARRKAPEAESLQSVRSGYRLIAFGSRVTSWVALSIRLSVRLSASRPPRIAPPEDGRRGWLGCQDSNLGMLGSKPSALPLGYTPRAAGPAGGRGR